MSIELHTMLAPSGVFCALPQAYAAGSYASCSPVGADRTDECYIYNPGVLTRYRGSYTTEQIESKAVSWLTECRKTRLIEKTDLNAYSQTCVQLAKDLATVGGHLRLGPLRGAARPCLLMDVMASGSGDFTFFNYKAGCQAQNAGRVKAELYPILTASDPEEPIYRIQVVDTAVGGHGISALTRYLWELKEKCAKFRKQKWELDLRIIHANDLRTNVSNIERVKSHSVSGVFEVQLQRYTVPDLVVEDYEAALGLEIVGDHGKVLVKQSYQPGQFVLKSGEDTCLVRSEALVTTFDELFAQTITDEMIYNQDLQQVGVVWNDYEQKG